MSAPFAAVNLSNDDPVAQVPTDAATLERLLADPHWRLFSGALYKIMVKGKDVVGPDGVMVPGDDTVIPFRPNRAQRRFIQRLWHRNVILKARQLGFTTLVAVLWLDHALFNANQRCGIIAQDREAAEAIFRDKVKFAYENLPPEVLARCPLKRDSAVELLFAHNNSSIRVATSMRSGTIHRLHISEFGKICAKYPDKAQEVITGSIPAVPINGILVIESTAEGQDGEFAKIVKIAQRHHLAKRVLTPRDYRFHFYPWWADPEYRMDSRSVEVAPEDHAYFDEIEAVMGCVLDPDQRAWYVATRDADFSGSEEKMWQEYPSTPDEAFQQSLDAFWLAKAMAGVRKRGGITAVPVLDAPVNTFWDIGNKDGCAVWFHQEHRGEDRFVDYMEAQGADLRDYAKALQDRGYLYGTHFMPHDANHRRLSDYNKNTVEMMQALLPGHRFVVVPPISQLVTGVQQLRKHMKAAWFDGEKCAEGLSRLDGYKKRFSRLARAYIDEADKTNGCTEGADALRQWAQAKELGMNFDYVPGSAGQYEEAAPPDWRL